ncbi:hypothetical protein GUI12_01790 [Anaplasmataceae bacterium AB001_6]|nr:hypothetical protein GUI12_01790 [Anaplasmataceae bacterium AB001_6]
MLVDIDNIDYELERVNSSQNDEKIMAQEIDNNLSEENALKNNKIQKNVNKKSVHHKQKRSYSFSENISRNFGYVIKRSFEIVKVISENVFIRVGILAEIVSKIVVQIVTILSAMNIIINRISDRNDMHKDEWYGQAYATILFPVDIKKLDYCTDF